MDAIVRRHPAPELERVDQIILPTPWDIGGLGPVQIYLIRSEPITLIDAGLKDAPSQRLLRAAFDELGFNPSAIARIILTHYHDDHLGLVQTLRGPAPSATVWAHELEAPIIEAFTPEGEEALQGTPELFREYGIPDETLARWNLWREELLSREPLCESTPVDRLLKAGDRISFEHFELEVIHAPGHSAGHMMLHEPETGILFGGDHVMHRTLPFTETYYLEGSGPPDDSSPRRSRFQGFVAYLRSLRELRKRSFHTILPGHRALIDEPARAIEQAIHHAEARCDRFEAALEQLAPQRGGSATGWELWQALFPQVDVIPELKLRMLALIGGLDELEDQGRIVTWRREDGVLVHSPNR